MTHEQDAATTAATTNDTCAETATPLLDYEGQTWREYAAIVHAWPDYIAPMSFIPSMPGDINTPRQAINLLITAAKFFLVRAAQYQRLYHEKDAALTDAYAQLEAMREIVREVAAARVGSTDTGHPCCALCEATEPVNWRDSHSDFRHEADCLVVKARAALVGATGATGEE